MARWPLLLAAALAAAASARAAAAPVDWQAEIDAAAARGGGRVVVPPGRHTTGGLVLRSNVELHLAKGAVLEGSPRTNDYPVVELPHSEGAWMAVVMAVGATNVAVTGEGEINGNGRAFPQPLTYGNVQGGQRPRGLFFADCAGVRLTDFTLRDTGSWGCVFKCCDGVEARRLTIDNHANANNDGIDVEARNVVIADCDVDSGDDAVCLKSNDPGFAVENVLVSNVVARSNCANFKLGTASHGVMRHILFVDCRAEAPRRDFPDLRPGKGKPAGAGWFYSEWMSSIFPPLGPGDLFSSNALAVECVDGGLVEDVAFRNVSVDGTAVPIFVRGGRRLNRATGTPPGKHYVLRNILFENITGRSLSCVPSSVTGVEGCRVADVTLRNVRLTAPGGGETAAERTRPVPEHEGRTPGSVMFEQLLPAHGLWARHVDGLVLENVAFTLAEGTFDRRDAVVLDDVRPAAAKPLELRPAATEVLIAPDAPRTVRFAAIDLTNHLCRIFGAPVPVVTAPRAGFVQVVLGDSEWTRAAGLDVGKLPTDAFYLKTAPGRLYIAGRDDPKCSLLAQLERGNYPRSAHATAFGVCEALERWAGVRFYFPDEYGTVVPAAAAVAVPPVDEVVKPQFTIRNCYIWGGGPVPDVPDGPEQARRKAWWQLRLRENTVVIPCCHGQNAFRIAERFHETHPEYFQLRADGTRCTETHTKYNYQKGQLCHTSPVWEIFRRETLERIRKGEKYVDLMPQDGMSACRCANCMSRYSQTNDLSLASGYCSELMWSNTVAVARAVKEAGLDGCVTQMAYGPCRVVPTCEIPDNVKVVLAVGGPWALSRPEIFEKQVDFVRGWSEKLKGRAAWLWTYPMKNYGRLMAHGVPQHAPRAVFAFYRRVAPYIDGSFVESNQGQDSIFYNYLNYYVFAKLAWRPDLDVEELLAEHNRTLFGSAAPHVAKFLDRLEELWIGKVAVPSLIGETEIGPMIKPPKEREIYRDVYTDAVMEELKRYLDAADAAVAGGSPEAMRAATLRRRFFDPLAAARALAAEGAAAR